MKKQITLQLLDGTRQNLYPKSDKQYNEVVSDLENSEIIIVDLGGGKSKTIKPQNILSWEIEQIPADGLTQDGLYKIINGKKYATPKLIEQLKKSRK